MKTLEKSWGRIPVILIILTILFIIIDGLVSVPPGHVAVIYDRGVGILQNPYVPGLHLKIPFWQRTEVVMETRLHEYTMSIASREGKKNGDDSIWAHTKDGQQVALDVTVQYRIKSENAPYIYQEIGEDYEQKIVRPGTRNAIRDVATSLNSSELFNMKGRKKAADDISKILSAYFAKNYVQLENVLLRNVSFSEKYMNSIEEKQIAQQKIKKAEYEREEEKIKKETRIINAEAEAEAKIINAEAEAKSIVLKGKSLADNPSVIQYEFVDKLSPAIKWGIMPDKIMPLLNIDGQVKGN